MFVAIVQGLVGWLVWMTTRKKHSTRVSNAGSDTTPIKEEGFFDPDDQEREITKRMSAKTVFHGSRNETLCGSWRLVSCRCLRLRRKRGCCADRTDDGVFGEQTGRKVEQRGRTEAERKGGRPSWR